MGGYADWLAAKARAGVEPAAGKPAGDKVASAEAPAGSKARSVKLSYNESRELAALPQQIEQLEAESTALNAELLDPELFRAQPGRARDVQQRLELIEESLLEMLGRWEELENKQKGTLAK